MGVYEYREYVSLTMEFRCNLRCVHCMIEGTMDRLEPESMDKLEDLLAYNERERRWKGLILTGSEITLRADLAEIAAKARARGFEHVRIQTHGVHLFRESYVQKLVDAGIDEYFVSVAGCDAESHDGITEVPGSFDRMMQGLENLEKHPGVISITNTVVTSRSYKLLTKLVDRLAHLKHLVQMEFWVYWPMKETDEKDLIVNHLELLPYLKEAIARARHLGRGVEVKNFPECLLGDERRALKNQQPLLFIDPSFWQEFQRNGFYQCVFKDRCASSECLGLNTAYTRRFGWHEEELRPFSFEEVDPPGPGEIPMCHRRAP